MPASRLNFIFLKHCSVSMQHGGCITALLDEGTDCTVLSVCALPGVLQPYAWPTVLSGMIGMKYATG